MTPNEKLPDVLADTICKCIRQVVEKANFDRSSIGRVVSRQDGYYEVKAFGGTHHVDSSLNFSINQRVAVIAPQGNMNKLYMLAI